MQLAIYQIDAFTRERFQGNSAAVVPLEHWLSDAQMQAIAMENNLSETAFVLREPDGVFRIRWFSPLTEIDFCGHATLASAFVLLEQGLATAPLTFRAAAVGDIPVVQLDDGRLEMDFPNRAPEPVDSPPAALLDGLGAKPYQVLRSPQAWFAVFEDEAQLVACLVADRAHGRVASGWWWPSVLPRLNLPAGAAFGGGRDPGAILAARPREAPAVLSTIVRWHEAPAVAAALTVVQPLPE